MWTCSRAPSSRCCSWEFDFNNSKYNILYAVLPYSNRLYYTNLPRSFWDWGLISNMLRVIPSFLEFDIHAMLLLTKKKCWKIRWETVFGKILLAIPFQLVINPAFGDNFNQLAMDHLSQYAGYRFYSSLMANDHAAWAMSLPPFLSNPHPF